MAIKTKVLIETSFQVVPKGKQRSVSVLSNPRLQDITNGVFKMVILLELEFCVLTRMKKGAGQYPKNQPLLLSSSGKPKKSKAGARSVCHYPVTLCSVAPGPSITSFPSHFYLAQLRPNMQSPVFQPFTKQLLAKDITPRRTPLPMPAAPKC